MTDKEDTHDKVVALINLSDAHFNVITENQSLILKNQEILSKQLAEINKKLDKLLK